MCPPPAAQLSRSTYLFRDDIASRESRFPVLTTSLVVLAISTIGPPTRLALRRARVSVTAARPLSLQAASTSDGSRQYQARSAPSTIGTFGVQPSLSRPHASPIGRSSGPALRHRLA